MDGVELSVFESRKKMEGDQTFLFIPGRGAAGLCFLVHYEVSVDLCLVSQ